jgi:hypothetical protein
MTVNAQRAPLSANVRAACDAAISIASKTPGIKTQRANGTFHDERFRAPISGCRILIDGSFKKSEKSGTPADNLHDSWQLQGWAELADYSADGHDGTSFAFRKGDVACFVRGEWDGGADEPEIPPTDPYHVTIICGRAEMFN